MQIPDEVRDITYVVPLKWGGKKIGTARVVVEKSEPVTTAARYVSNLTTDVSLELDITDPEFEARLAKNIVKDISLVTEEESDAGE